MDCTQHCCSTTEAASSCNQTSRKIPVRHTLQAACCVKASSAAPDVQGCAGASCRQGPEHNKRPAKMPRNVHTEEAAARKMQARQTTAAPSSKFQDDLWLASAVGSASTVHALGISIRHSAESAVSCLHCPTSPCVKRMPPYNDRSYPALSQCAKHSSTICSCAATLKLGWRQRAAGLAAAAVPAYSVLLFQ
jgi:hypothetical protein